MQRLQWVILGFMLAAVATLVSGLSLVQGLQHNLRLEVTEQLQIEEYLLLSAEMTTLYSEYGRLAAEDTPQNAAELDALRRRVDALLLAIQTQVARRNAENEDSNDALSIGQREASNPELLQLTLEIERTLSEVERAEALIASGSLDEAELVLRTTLDGRLAAYLLPTIDAAVKRERKNEEAALRELDNLLDRALFGVIVVAAGLALVALLLWIWVLRPQRRALAQLERQVERLRGASIRLRQVPGPNPNLPGSRLQFPRRQKTATHSRKK
ncbi:MAG: hypothetical protein QNI90_03635 [Dinoroseobacter sp.]|nr:hypothetical protein [Dinoroseobacter sp.]